MPQLTCEVGNFTRVTSLLTGVRCLSSGPIALIGIGVATVLTGQFVQLWSGNTASAALQIVGTCSMASNTYTPFPVALPSGLTYQVTNEDVDLTIYWMPT